MEIDQVGVDNGKQAVCCVTNFYVRQKLSTPSNAEHTAFSLLLRS
jgi:hypothetical protein